MVVAPFMILDFIYIYYIIHTLLYVFNNEVATNLNVKHHQLFL
jgi:hypothetical protein